MFGGRLALGGGALQEGGGSSGEYGQESGGGLAVTKQGNSLSYMRFRGTAKTDIVQYVDAAGQAEAPFYCIGWLIVNLMTLPY
jgi:hypothetical protein